MQGLAFDASTTETHAKNRALPQPCQGQPGHTNASAQWHEVTVAKRVACHLSTALCARRQVTNGQANTSDNHTAKSPNYGISPHRPLLFCPRSASPVCDAGYGGSSCTICIKGSYSAGGNVTSPTPTCISCPTGETTSLPGATSQALCTLAGGGEIDVARWQGGGGGGEAPSRHHHSMPAWLLSHPTVLLPSGCCTLLLRGSTGWAACATVHIQRPELLLHT